MCINNLKAPFLKFDSLKKLAFSSGLCIIFVNLEMITITVIVNWFLNNFTKMF